MSDIKSFIVPPGAYNLWNFPKSVDPWVPGSLAGVGSLNHVTTFDVETEVYGTSYSDMRCRHAKPCADGQHDFHLHIDVFLAASVPAPNDICFKCLWLRKELTSAQGAYWKCECGAEAVGSDRHAVYCPKFRR